MYKLSYEKCVCFIFLVMVVILSCSGFRIDKLAMTDISKRNSYTSSTSLNSHSDFLSRLVQNSGFSDSAKHQRTPETSSTKDRYLAKKYFQRPHRIRHTKKQHKQQAALFEPAPTSRIDAIIIPPSVEFDTTFQTNTRSTTRPMANEQFAQIPPTDLLRPESPTPAIIMRSQRSPNKHKNHHQQRNAKLPCQEQDVARKAYLANTVVLAKAESMSSNRVRNYSVSFKIVKRFKSTQYAVDDNIRLTFLNETKRMNCESELEGRMHVKAQIQQSKEYYLFLNSHGKHNYTVLGMPVLKRRRKNKELDRIIQNIANKNFEPKLKKPILNVTSTNVQPRSKLRLHCKVRGYPIPVISWKKNESLLYNNNNTRIIYSNKGTDVSEWRKSTLVIRNAQERDSGRYQCVATGVKGQWMAAQEDIQISNNRDECSEEFKKDFCQNGGTCFYTSKLKEVSCACPDGYTGRYCENKAVSLHMGMNQTTEQYRMTDADNFKI
ncbi:PREDICTED: protein vein isoform X2 [Nicrophorus vespilloides]|uniref:Protein vein isoform X2 n=1 Tax=Nicrophorus vespilloides TaxID=110193 RepID=A0ABM1MHC1_NICVS|nr:PREDICTED: protein vein isoform X2 [Nicrophorus vespilloides]